MFFVFSFPHFFAPLVAISNLLSGSLFGFGSSSGGHNSSSVRYLSPYYIIKHVRGYEEHFDMTRLSMLTSTGASLVASYWRPVCDAVAMSWSKHQEQGVSHGVLNMQAACREMQSPFVLRSEDDDHQTRFITLLAEVHRRSKVPRVISSNRLAFLDNLDWPYFISSRGYWLLGFHTEAPVRVHVKLFCAGGRMLGSLVCGFRTGSSPNVSFQFTGSSMKRLFFIHTYPVSVFILQWIGFTRIHP